VAFARLRHPPNTLYSFHRGSPIDVARNSIVDKFLESGAKWLLFLDSVPSYTPILIRDPLTKEIDIKAISDLAIFTGTGIERVKPSSEFEVLEQDKWVKVKAVIRHPFEGYLRRISTIAGVVDITKNHSIYRFGTGYAGGNSLVDVGTLEVGQCLQMPRVPFRKTDKGLFFAGPTELAWLYGFFVAEGSVSRNMISIANKKSDLIDKASEILNDHFNVKSCIVEDRNDMLKLEVVNKRLSILFRSLFYTDGNKKVPAPILNAPKRIIEEFLRGYADGDGHVYSGGHLTLAPGSQVEAAGLIFLLKRLEKTYSIQIRADKPKALNVCVNKGEKDYSDEWKDAIELREKAGWGATRIARELGIKPSRVKGWIYGGKKPWYAERNPRRIRKLQDIYYKGYLYDLATESQRFSGGVGPFLLHNSDVLPPEDGLERLMSHNLPVVSALYYRRHLDRPGMAPHPALWKLIPEGTEVTCPACGAKHTTKPGKYQPILNPPPNMLVEADAIGMGFCLIHRRVFEKVPRPWFRWTLGWVEPGVSEDFAACELFREHGYKILVDTGCRCGHVADAVIDGEGRFASPGV
jgi:intein/homing endonuclease